MLVVLGSIVLAIFTVFWYPIKRLIRGKKMERQKKAIDPRTIAIKTWNDRAVDNSFLTIYASGVHFLRSMNIPMSSADILDAVDVRN